MDEVLLFRIFIQHFWHYVRLYQMVMNMLIRLRLKIMKFLFGQNLQMIGKASALYKGHKGHKVLLDHKDPLDLMQA